MACQHEDFSVRVNVGRLSAVEGGPISNYTADVQIQCAQCGEAFCFIGMEHGSDPAKPMCSFLADEARLPIRPSSEANKDLPIIPGFRVKRSA